MSTHTLTRTQSYTLTYSNTAAGSSVCNNWELLPNLCCLHVLRLRSELTVQKGSRPIPSYSEGVFYDLDHLSMWMWPTLSEPFRTMAVLMRIKPFYFFCLFLFWWNITKKLPLDSYSGTRLVEILDSIFKSKTSYGKGKKQYAHHCDNLSSSSFYLTTWPWRGNTKEEETSKIQPQSLQQDLAQEVEAMLALK